MQTCSPGCAMHIATLLLIGIDQSVSSDLQKLGYTTQRLPDIEAMNASDISCDLMILNHTLLKGTDLERIYFLNNTATILLYIDDPATIGTETLTVLKRSAIECLYRHEVESGLVAARLNRIYLDAQLNNSLYRLTEERSKSKDLEQELLFQKQVLERERLLSENILASATFGLSLMGVDGIVISINQEAVRLLDLHAESYAGKEYQNIFPEPVNKVIGAFMHTCNRSTSVPARTHTQTKLGSTYIEISCYQLLNTEGEPTGIIIFLHDITEQQRMTQQLFQAEKLSTIGTMLSGIAHELRNPLAIISARTKRATDKFAADAEPLRKYFDSINQQTNRCITIVNNLLDFARNTAVETGYHTVQDIVDDALSYCSYQSSFRAIEVAKDFPPSLSVFGDRSRYTQVILNLFTNAMDAMSDGGTLTVRAYKKGADYIMITVTDTGGGIDPDIQKNIFDPFFTTKDPGKGTGLGLAIVYKIVQESGGTIWLSCDNNTTTFYLKLPSIREYRHE